jgi:tetratricopeptide (TPR) repeat protein
LQEAIQYFQQATAKDPSSARAYAGLAQGYAILAAYGSQPEAEIMSKARAAALKALEIDESSSEAHTALALIVQNHDWDWQTSEKEFRRAIELNPNDATAHHWYARRRAIPKFVAARWFGTVRTAWGLLPEAVPLNSKILGLKF